MATAALRSGFLKVSLFLSSIVLSSLPLTWIRVLPLPILGPLYSRRREWSERREVWKEWMSGELMVLGRLIGA